MIGRRLPHLALVVLALTAAACGDDTAGGAGGGDAYSEDPVLGAEHDGGCETLEAFDAQCDEEGGIRTETCQGGSCTGWGGRCAPPPPPLEEGQFVCGDAEVCVAGQYCITFLPTADGCSAHRCATIPTSCTEAGEEGGDTATCECLIGSTYPKANLSRDCAVVDGHFEITDR